MKKYFLLSMLLLLAATTLSAQTILKGDMNNDNEVTIADVTSVVNVVLGKAPKETINAGGSPYLVDNASVVGTWYAPDGSNFTLNEDGTTNFPGGDTYEFMPTQGRLLIYDANEHPIKVLPLLKVESWYLLTVDYATNVFTCYTNLDPDTYVDLGLPSSTVWATCNVGANSPEEFGDYFAWGETTGYNGGDGKTTFDWSTYKWCKGSENTITKYCTNSSYGNEGFTDNKTKLDLEYDAAYANLGPAWRMPSMEQFDELINSDYTTTVWTAQNGVDGLKITSRTNGKSIFLPAAGYDGISNNISYYLSRSFNSSEPCSAGTLLFGNGYSIVVYYDRCKGLPVRPVRSK
ncbi:MAG: hypothetical protein IKD78_12040 [Bacteroidales bacterium]|nr:hypothetical protein [Bacteroidales bacterium]